MPLDRAGTWSFRAEWTGRGIGSLRLVEPGGRTIGRIAGASPLELRLPVPPGAEGDRVTVHFSSLGARGELRGILSAIAPPSPEEPGGAGDPRAPSASGTGVPAGPGACLLTGPAGHDEGAAPRRLRELAEALEDASPEALAWVRRWTGRALAASLALDRRGREGFDELWEGLRLDPCPDAAVGRAFRGVVALLEDLARREEGARATGRERAAARRRALTGALGCLAPVDPGR